MNYDPKLEEFLHDYFTKTPAPWLITFCVADFDKPIGQYNYGIFRIMATEYEIDKLAGRLNLQGNEGECTILLNELYLENENITEKSFLATYNYAWAVISENLEECPRWMIHVAALE